MKKILFFGELPPRTIHGASISNLINIKILKKLFTIDIVEEYSDLRHHSSFSLSKMLHFFNGMVIAWGHAIRFKYVYYYGVIYLSRIGICKNILIIFIFKLFNPQAKVILHFHRSDLKIFLMKFFNQFLFRTLDLAISKYIVLSNQQLEEMKLYTSNKVCLLYNSIENIKTEEVITNADAGKVISILFLSNYIKEKGLTELLQAAEDLNYIFPEKFKVNCYGSFSKDSYKAEVLETVKNKNYISINGSVYGNDKVNVLNNVDLVVLPSYNEGLPLILLESMAIGKPIIITKVGYIVEALGEDYELYCKPGDSISIVNAIIKFNSLINKNDLSDKLKLKYKKFSFENHTQVLNSIFYK